MPLSYPTRKTGFQGVHCIAVPARRERSQSVMDCPWPWGVAWLWTGHGRFADVLLPGRCRDIARTL